jgi:Natural resistance-associated macrophage protein-like
MTTTVDKPTEPPIRAPRVWTKIGPGLLVAAAGIGAGDIVSSTMAASSHGLALLWVVALAAVLKGFLNEGIARWQLATATTAIEGWCRHLPAWVRWYFAAYLVLWTVSVSAALTSACGLGIATLTGGAVSRPWGAVSHAIAGGSLVAIGGFAGFAKVTKVLIGTMFFTILGCALLTLPSGDDALRGFVPSIPVGGAASVLSVLGGIGESIAMLAYNYWLREERMAGPDDTLGATIGPLGFYAYAAGFWAAVFASLLGVWQSLPYLFADYYGLLRGLPRERRAELTKVTSVPYRLALLFTTIMPIPLAFIDQPLFMVRLFTIVGSLFIPFLAGTLLYLNNVILPIDSGVPRNSRWTNAILVLAMLVFAAVGASEAGLLRVSR